MLNPCYELCYRYGGRTYTKECDVTCDYAKMAKMLKTVLINYTKCEYCRKYPICPVGSCYEYEKYELNFEKIKADYQV